MLEKGKILYSLKSPIPKIMERCFEEMEEYCEKDKILHSLQSLLSIIFSIQTWSVVKKLKGSWHCA